MGEVDFNVEKLLNYLKQKLVYLSNVKPDDVIVSKFTEGQSNPTYAITIPGHDELVLRRKPFGKLLRGAHQIEREFQVMSALGKVDFPVPKMIDICEDPSVIGANFFIMERIKGHVINLSMEKVDEVERRNCLRNVVETLATLHSYDINQLNLNNFGRRGGYCTRVLRTWTKQYESCADATKQSHAEMKELIARLEVDLAKIDDNQAALVHGDYSLMNVMYDNDQRKVAAVLDWELSTIGHPLMDLAYLCLFYHAPQEYLLINGVPLQSNESLKRVLTEDEMVEAYCKLRGIPYPVANWSFYVALNFFKLASIVQGVYSRHVGGNASSPGAESMKYLVGPLVTAALNLLKRSDSSTGGNMDLSISPNGQQVLNRVKVFLKKHVDPHEKKFASYLESDETVHLAVDMMKKWRAQARRESLWNLFLSDVSGLSNVDYAHIAEYLGRSYPYSTVFNCNAPDTGNMEVLHMYGSEYQKETWLKPLLNGEYHSAFCMTEPEVASSDATNMQLTIRPDGEGWYVVNGRKWWSTGAGNPDCRIGIVMGRVDDGGGDVEKIPRHRRHSMIVVPLESPGVKIVRMLTVFGYHDRPHGHGEIIFDQVRVPARNLILGEGRGFEIAQGRLGPGRIHHCMRSIGLAERSLEYFMKRTLERRTFGKRIIEHQVVQHQLAECRIDIDQCRLLTLHCARMIDLKNTKLARQQIAMIKVAVPRMLCRVIDQTIQVHGGAGVCQDFPLAQWYAFARTLRLADGPDEVHLGTVAKCEIRNQIQKSKL